MTWPGRGSKIAILSFMLLLLSSSQNYTAQAQVQSPSFNPAPWFSSDIISQFNTLPISSAMLGDLMPNIPNLKFGFQYFFGSGYKIGQFNMDYLLPVRIGRDEVMFGEIHGNYWDYFGKPDEGSVYGGNVSLGTGYRRIVADRVLAGMNFFYDSAKGYSKWYQSGSLGFEMAANVGISSAIDFNANWYYGDLFSSTEPSNMFKKTGSNYDLMAGYSMALLNEALDLRLKAAMYNFDVGNNVYAYMTGADLTTRNGLFTFTYEHGSNRINGSWDNFAVFLNVGFLIGNYFMGDNPFTMPDPVFSNGQRNLSRMFSSSVNRISNQAPPPAPTPSPDPLAACNAFANGNRQLQTATGETFYLALDNTLNFCCCSQSTNATVTVANPAVNPVLIALSNSSKGISTNNLWVTMGTQTITQQDFPQWFTGGPWTEIRIQNVVNTPNTQGPYWIPVSISITYGAANAQQ